MDQTTQLLALIGAAALGMGAILGIVRRRRHEVESTVRRQRYAVSTEGQSRCPECGFGNLVTDVTCASCGKRLPR